MRFQHRALVAACLALLGHACRKDKDSQPPTVRITAPGAGFSVGIPGSIAVGVAVSDDRRVERLSVLVADADGVPIAAPVALSVNATSRELIVDLPLSDERIPSGQYVLTAVATDGANTARDFLPITVQAAPLRVRSTYLVPPPGQAAPFTITRIDSAGGISPFVTLGELQAAACDLDHLYTAGTATEPLRRWRLSSGGAQVAVENPAQHPAFFSSLRRDPADGRIYACTADGLVRGFAGSGLQAFSGAEPTGFYCEATARMGGFLFCAAYNPVSQQRLLVKHGYASGERLAQFPLAAAPVALWERDAQHLLLFGNTPSGGVVLDISAEQGGAWEVRAFPGEPIRCVERFAPGRFVIGFDAGLRRFDYQAASATTIVAGLAASGLTFDPVSGAMLAAAGSSVIAFDPLTGAIATSQTAPHPVGAILLRFNR